MSTQPHHDPLQITPDPERLHLYHRQQVSAMLDGELAPDEARFMLRRLQHDAELAGCWERWQVCGDVLRGRADDLLPADFAQRVARAIHVPQTAAATHAATEMRGWRRWWGTALAASLALAAWVVVRAPVEPAPARNASGTSAAVTAATAPLPTAAKLPAQVPAATAIAENTPRAAARGTAATARASSPATALAAATPADAAMPPAGDLLAPTRQAAPAPRPWPRPLLPAATGVGSLVGYGTQTGWSVPPPKDAFQPRWPDAATAPDRYPPPPDTAVWAADKHP